MRRFIFTTSRDLLRAAWIKWHAGVHEDDGSETPRDAAPHRARMSSHLRAVTAHAGHRDPALRN